MQTESHRRPRAEAHKTRLEIRRTLIAEVTCVFTLLALRCAHTFYPKRVKDVETFRSLIEEIGEADSD